MHKNTENTHRNKNHYKKINMKSIDKPKNAIYNMANMKQTEIKWQKHENDFCTNWKNELLSISYSNAKLFQMEWTIYNRKKCKSVSYCGRDCGCKKTPEKLRIPHNRKYHWVNAYKLEVKNILWPFRRLNVTICSMKSLICYKE